LSIRGSRARWLKIGRWAALIAGALLLLTFLSVMPVRLLFEVSDSEIARAKCMEYRDAAVTWAKVRGALPTRLEDMEVPLLPGEIEFIEMMDDPWGHPYELERDGDDVRVRSAGPDGRTHTGDDISVP